MKNTIKKKSITVKWNIRLHGRKIYQNYFKLWYFDSSINVLSDPNVMNLIESIILPIGWKMSTICEKITFHVVLLGKRGYICMSKLRHTQFHTLEWDAFKTFYRKQTTVIIFTQVIFGTWNIFPLHLQFHIEMSTIWALRENRTFIV